MTNIVRHLPYYACGEIVKGFGRGSRELGFPTANFSSTVTDALPESFTCGIYYGWAKVDDSPIYQMVMSVGYNPFYKNTKKTMETHILHNFNKDLYGSRLKVCIVDRLRDEKNFHSLDDLIAEINNDIKIAKENLNEPKYLSYKDDNFFSSTDSN